MLPILLIIKFIIFTNIINVEYNRIPIILNSSLISLFVFSLIYKSKRKRKTTLALIFYAAVSILLLVDATYFSQFRTLTSVAIIKQISQINTVGDSLKVLLNLKILALIIDVPFVVMCHSDFFICHSERSRGIPGSVIPSEVEGSQVLHPSIIALALLVLIFYYNSIGQITSITNQEFFTYHIVDLKNYLLKDELVEASEIYTDSDIEELKGRRELKTGKLTGIGKEKNLIVLQVEALQNFVIDFEYYGQEVTPNINELIKDKSTIYYNNYYQSVGKANTADAEFASNNSLYPSLSGPTYMEYGENSFYGLPWLLRDNGYTAWAFHGNDKDYWNRNDAYVNQGYERFISQDDFEFEEIIGFGIKDEDFFSQSINYLKELDRVNDNPFYAFMVTVTSHTPFEMPEEHHVLNIREKHRGTMVGNYINAIHYADEQIGKFINLLKKEGLYDNSVIVLYGDHYAIPVTDEESKVIMTDILDKPYDYDEMMNVPLMIHIPGEEINETITKLGSQIDFYPTMANIMGYKIEKGMIFGKDLNNNNETSYVFPQIYIEPGSVITEEAIFEMSRDGIFDHSKARQRETSKEIDIKQFEKIHKTALKEIQLSNYILKEDNLLQ
ncbi:LTA synthase family protein [Tissierella sp. Yu-01]|uniref:LTA synthase family protein n=1 Tax=Tissierella sp. Yu-01 TaxID=3035694 RepID=UPI00240CE75C|nr:LTA synthase family protein [Tissierella sp. Yu-01]WFA08520.1 LTA synthase family protein [Tissierella sp. Yu-01]